MAVPQSEGMGDAEYMHAMHHIILPVAYDFAPDLVLVRPAHACSIPTTDMIFHALGTDP